jgi:hypothetical protein
VGSAAGPEEPSAAVTRSAVVVVVVVVVGAQTEGTVEAQTEETAAGPQTGETAGRVPTLGRMGPVV